MKTHRTDIYHFRYLISTYHLEDFLEEESPEMGSIGQGGFSQVSRKSSQAEKSYAVGPESGNMSSWLITDDGTIHMIH